MKAWRRLKEVTPRWLIDGGIFTALDTLSVPWALENLGHKLDMYYYGVISGQKIVSPLVDDLLDDTGVLTANSTALLAQSILSVYAANWSKQYATLNLEYNPINNYDMKETYDQTDDLTYGHVISHDNTDTLAVSHTDAINKSSTDNITVNRSDTETPNTTTTNTTTGTSTTNDDTTNNDNIIRSIAGFNSTDYVQKDKDVTTGAIEHDISTSTSDTSDVHYSGTIEHSTSETDKHTITATDNHTLTGTDTHTINGSDNHTGTDTHSITHTLTRSGNIGVTTSQQMIQSERDLWLWNFFTETVFRDVNKILVCPIY